MPIDKNVPRIPIGQMALSLLILCDFDDVTIAKNFKLCTRQRLITADAGRLVTFMLMFSMSITHQYYPDVFLPIGHRNRKFASVCTLTAIKPRHEMWPKRQIVAKSKCINMLLPCADHFALAAVCYIGSR